MCRPMSRKPIYCLAILQPHLEATKNIIFFSARRRIWQIKINYLINVGKGALKLRVLLIVYRLSEPLNNRCDRSAGLNKFPNIILGI